MNHRLLLIEDSPTQLLTIKRTLEAEGYTVISAQNGTEGLAYAYAQQPDLIISDVVMSGINGYQLCRLVKHDPELAHTPVILLTKLDGLLDRFWGLQSGADRYIPKEPGFINLLKATREILGSHNHTRLRALNRPSQTPTTEEINARLNQLLERLLFEFTIVDAVHKISEEILDLPTISQRLFDLIASILNYFACALVINHQHFSKLVVDVKDPQQEDNVKAYVAKTAEQLGLPLIEDIAPKSIHLFEHALTQPIDAVGHRAGLLIIIPWAHQKYSAADQKVVRLIAEQLSTILRLYLSYAKPEEKPAIAGMR